MVVESRDISDNAFLTEKQNLNLAYGINIRVRGKRGKLETGTTPYYFSYSFKGEQEGNPIIPKDILEIATELKRRLVNHGQTLIAFDRGGTALGVTLSLITDLPLFIAFGYLSRPEEGISWHEPGGGKYLGIPALPEESHVVLVDDEINTGNTFANAIDTFRNNSIHIDQVLVVTEVNRQEVKGRQLLQDQNCALESLYLIPEPVFDQTLNEYIFPYR